MNPAGPFTVYVPTLPKCDFASTETHCPYLARYDFRSLYQNRWAYGCPYHYFAYRANRALGLGNGQRLLLPHEPCDDVSLARYLLADAREYRRLQTLVDAVREAGLFTAFQYESGIQWRLF